MVSGVVLLGASLTSYLVVHALGIESPPPFDLAAHVAITAPFFGALIYGGRWLERSDLPVGRRPRIGLWFFGGSPGSSCSTC